MSPLDLVIKHVELLTQNEQGVEIFLGILFFFFFFCLLNLQSASNLSKLKYLSLEILYSQLCAAAQLLDLVQQAHSKKAGGIFLLGL